MKKRLLFAGMALLASLAFAVEAGAHANYTGYSGAPGSKGQCAYMCHEQHDFNPTVTVSGFPTTYTPGQQYTVSVAHQGGSSIMNFNASVRMGAGSVNGGTIAAGTNTSTYNVNPQETNGVHFTSSAQNSGTFLWTAPAVGTGTVNLYWAGLQGDLSTGSDTLVVLVSNEGSAPQDHAPVLTSIPPQTVPEGGHLGVRVTASDPDGDAITLLAQQLPTNASFADSTGGVGALIFNPDFTQSGPYQVRIIATANSLADTQMVQITVTNVDRAPVLATIQAQTVPEGGHLGVRVTAGDPDGDAITFQAQQMPTHASFADSGNGIGGLVFDPDTTQAGLYQILVVANSNSLADSQLVNIEVTGAGGGCVYIPGDINGNGEANSVDVSFGVNYLKGRVVPPIDCSAQCPAQGSPFFAAGDVNGSCDFNGIDITYFVGYLKGRVDLATCPDCPPAR